MYMYHNKHSYEQVAIAARPCSAPIQLASCTTTYQIGIAICPSLKLDASGVGSYCLLVPNKALNQSHKKSKALNH